MDPTARKTALRMIPYGLYVLTARSDSGGVGAATVNWVTQASFEPPLIAVGVKADSTCHGLIKEAGAFALNVLGRGQARTATAFFKPVEVDGRTIGGEPFRPGETGVPVLEAAPAFVECRLVASVEEGDHSVFVARVVAAGVHTSPEGRPDDATLRLSDLGEAVFYGG